MAGFGLAPIPAAAIAASGGTALAGFGARLPRNKLPGALGAAIPALGLASLVEPEASLSALCLGGRARGYTAVTSPSTASQADTTMSAFSLVKQSGGRIFSVLP